MNILYIVGNNLQFNNSANISHNAFINGFLQNGAQIDVVMASIGLLPLDSSMDKFSEVTYFEYSSFSPFNQLAEVVKMKIAGNQYAPPNANAQNQTVIHSENPAVKEKMGGKLREALRIIYYKMIDSYGGVYGQSKYWIQNASKFISDKQYDLVISNSSPSSSHAVVERLLKKHKITAKKWIQIWEDPWTYDLYTNGNQKIKKEEERLLSLADYVFYVSPLTYHYQKKYFKKEAKKMRVVPLPFSMYFGFSQTDKAKQEEEITLGYFGDYHSFVRNLEPFYHALLQSDSSGYIYGDTDCCWNSTEKIFVHGRVGFQKLSEVQNKTHILVHLCNLKGGQIPGKIYHYSCTDKPILFILDGTEEEKTLIKDYFSKYDRYTFCDNTTESIMKAIGTIKASYFTSGHFASVLDFSPKIVAQRILKEVYP